MKDPHPRGKKLLNIITGVIIVISVITAVCLIFVVFIYLISNIPDSIVHLIEYIILGFFVLFLGWIAMKGVIEYLNPGTDDLIPFWFEPDSLKNIENPLLRVLAIFFLRILLIVGPFLVVLFAVLFVFFKTKDWSFAAVMIGISCLAAVYIVFRIIKGKTKKREERNKGKLPP